MSQHVSPAPDVCLPARSRPRHACAGKQLDEDAGPAGSGASGRGHWVTSRKVGGAVWGARVLRRLYALVEAGVSRMSHFPGTSMLWHGRTLSVRARLELLETGLSCDETFTKGSLPFSPSC